MPIPSEARSNEVCMPLTLRATGSARWYLRCYRSQPPLLLNFECLEVLSGDGFIHHASVAAAFSEIAQASRRLPPHKARGGRALASQRVQVRELLVDAFREFKRIEGRSELLERFDFGSIKGP